MKTKPLVFFFVYTLCLTVPTLNVFSSEGASLDIFNSWPLFLLAAIFLIKLRPWSYLGFMGTFFYIVYNVISYDKFTWPFTGPSSMVYNYFVSCLSVAIFCYFLVPQMRELFFNRDLQWWDTPKRYPSKIQCQLLSNSLPILAVITNISCTGAFLKSTGPLKAGEVHILEINFYGNKLIIPVMIVHKFDLGDHSGYGIRFTFNTFKQLKSWGSIISFIRKTHTGLALNFS